MTIHFLLQLSHSNGTVLSVVGSAKTHLSNWIVLLITPTAAVRVPIKVGKRFKLTKKKKNIFNVPLTVASLCGPFCLFAELFTQEQEWRFCKYNIKNWEGCRGPESATMHNVLWSSGYSVEMCEIWWSANSEKLYQKKKYISDSDRDKSTACNKNSNTRWEETHERKKILWHNLKTGKRLWQVSVLISTSNIIIANTEKYPWKMNTGRSLWNSFLALLETVV